MSKVVILTDTTAYLPQNYVDELPIKVLPLTLYWDGKSYRDGIDMSPEEFYTRLDKSATLPTTSQVTVNTFQEKFKELLDEGYEVLTMLTYFDPAHSVAMRSALGGTSPTAVETQLEHAQALLK